MHVRHCLSLALVCLLAVPLCAADEKKKKKKAKGPAAVKVPKGVELTDAQQEQVAALEKEYGPKIAELRQKLGSIMTDEQRQAQQVAAKAAKEAGKKGKELKQAVQAAVQLTDAQQEQLKEVRQEMRSLMKEARGKLLDLLTDEQKSQIKGKRKKEKKNA